MGNRWKVDHELMMAMAGDGYLNLHHSSLFTLLLDLKFCFKTVLEKSSGDWLHSPMNEWITTDATALLT